MQPRQVPVFIDELQQCIELVDQLQKKLVDHFWQNLYTNVVSSDRQMVLQGGMLIGLYFDAMEFATRVSTKEASRRFMTPLWLAANFVGLFDDYCAANRAHPTTLNQFADTPLADEAASLLRMKNKLNIDWDISIKDFKQLLHEIKNTIRSASIFFKGCQQSDYGAPLLFNFFQNGGRDVLKKHIAPLLDVERIVNEHRPSPVDEFAEYLRFKDGERSVRPS